MDKMIAAVLGLALCAGCATSQMKSTPFYTGDSTVYKGKAEDRVNLWPLGYYRDPALSVLWPAFSLTDDHLAVRPLYSQFRQGGADRPYDEFNFLWPLCQFDTAHGRHRVFPVFWGERYFDFFPLVWWEKDEFFNVFPIWWSNRDRDLLLPLYYRDADTFATLLFGWDTDSSWAFPLYYNDSDCFVSLPWCMWGNEKDRGYLIPPLLTYFNTAGDFFTPLCGKSGETNWLLPFWWRDRNGFMTLLYGQNETTGGNPGMEYVFPPLLSGAETHKDGSSAIYALLGLAAWKNGKDGVFDRSWLFPLWYADDRKFLTIPYQHVRNDFSSVALIAGMRHGEHRSGGWLWPLFGWKNDERMPEAEAMLNADTLDPRVTFEAKGAVVNGHTNKWDHVFGTVGASDGSWCLSGLSTSNRSIFWGAGCGKVHGRDVRDFGNVLAFKRESRRTVVFDPKTRKKMSDCEKGNSGLLCNFLWASEYEKRNGTLAALEKSVLWCFWHYEMKDGNVSVDSFPFFTYDAKKDGYEKTSLLWRLFRNEYDPKEGRKVDVLFVPVWR